MSSERERFEARQIRGLILSTLKDYYPNGLSGATIVKQVVRPVFPATDQRDAVAFLIMLKDAGYVESIKELGIRKADSLLDQHFRSTPKGIEIAEGTSSDPSIVVE
jgi:hypothetical protein